MSEETFISQETEEPVVSEKQKVFHSIWFPVVFIALLWIIKSYEIVSFNSFSKLGLYPLRPSGLIGIITSPLIHSNWEHLLNNTPALFVLLWATFYFYKGIAWKVFVLTWFMNGFWLWFFGRESYHIGASGLVYGFGTFLFLGGIIRLNRNLLAISLLVAFMYGSMIWGIFPLEEHVSWESHLTGFLAGIVLSIYFRSYGPPRNLLSKNENEIGEEYDEELEELINKQFDDEEYLQEDHIKNDSPTN
ncbi:MAG: rhomboid family intramembrane serine protease [Bacteroidales bacterium]|nr:rhomboid family intramembrane serine protease [Bacteroidales bacterium]